MFEQALVNVGENGVEGARDCCVELRLLVTLLFVIPIATLTKPIPRR